MPALQSRWVMSSRVEVMQYQAAPESRAANRTLITGAKRLGFCDWEEVILLKKWTGVARNERMAYQ